MAKLGHNLPGFTATQLEFSAHIRNPEINPAPQDVEPRRMQIYLDLFFNNIQSFLASAFPVAKSILGRDRWLELVREFMHRHASESPYFLQISEEFLTFLNDRGLAQLPGFLLELCHYEWVELSLDVAEEEEQGVDQTQPTHTDLALDRLVVLNPCMRMLTYAYNVHEIGPDHQPVEAPQAPTFLVVYRDAQLNVRFMASNPLTHRLLALLEDQTPNDSFEVLLSELNEAGQPVGRRAFLEQAQSLLSRLVERGIVLGTAAVEKAPT